MTKEARDFFADNFETLIKAIKKLVYRLKNIVQSTMTKITS